MSEPITIRGKWTKEDIVNACIFMEKTNPARRNPLRQPSVWIVILVCFLTAGVKIWDFSSRDLSVEPVEIHPILSTATVVSTLLIGGIYLAIVFYVSSRRSIVRRVDLLIKSNLFVLEDSVFILDSDALTTKTSSEEHRYTWDAFSHFAAAQEDLILLFFHKTPATFMLIPRRLSPDDPTWQSIQDLLNKKIPASPTP